MSLPLFSLCHFQQLQVLAASLPLAQWKELWLDRGSYVDEKVRFETWRSLSCYFLKKKKHCLEGWEWGEQITVAYSNISLLDSFSVNTVKRLVEYEKVFMYYIVFYVLFLLFFFTIYQTLFALKLLYLILLYLLQWQ